MIVMKQKDMTWLLERAAKYRKVIVLGCGSCATVCLAGGEREVEELCCALQLALVEREGETELAGMSAKRVCDWEFLEPIQEELRSADAIFSLACGAGMNLLSEKLESVDIIPAVDTLFMGTNVAPDGWREWCAGCGECVIDRTFGICPVARCAKTILNGPCGGSNDGQCELSTAEAPVECAWALIIERMEKLGTLDRLQEIQAPKDWSTSGYGGPRRRVREDLRVAAETESE